MRWEDGWTTYRVERMHAAYECTTPALALSSINNLPSQHFCAPPQPGAAKGAVISSAHAPQPGGAQQGSSDTLGISPLVSCEPLVGACWLRCSSAANQLVHTSSYFFQSQNSAPLVAASRLAGGARISARGQGVQVLRGRAGLERAAPSALRVAPCCCPPVIH